MSNFREIQKQGRSRDRVSAKSEGKVVVGRGSTTGSVKFFDPVKGYGFVGPDGLRVDYFVHISAVEGVAFEPSIHNFHGLTEGPLMGKNAFLRYPEDETVGGSEGEVAIAELSTQQQPDEAARLALLDQAASGTATATDALDRLEDVIREDAATLIGGPAVVGRAIGSETDLLVTLIQGFPSGVLVALRESGLPHRALEQVIAPRRTLMRRKAEGQRLTRAESDAAWRLAHLLALATHVLDGRKAAIDWLMRAKLAFANHSPIDLAETSIGAAHVERLLRRLEWGDVA